VLPLTFELDVPDMPPLEPQPVEAVTTARRMTTMAARDRRGEKARRRRMRK
jgi:hypothetical protein